MGYVLRFLDYLERSRERWEREQREAYLSQATDLYDLERRMREVESSSRHWS